MRKTIKSTLTPHVSAKIIADSITDEGKRITSFELEYPRYIHAELLTHRLFSRNAASSRAIPIKKKLKMIWNNPAMPIEWGRNKSGMQSSETIDGSIHRAALRFVWKTAAKSACVLAWGMSKIGLHKQWCGRILEPFEQYKIVLTATEFTNWFWLRDHPDAQPEIRELAQVMSLAMSRSEPFELHPGEWHLPYIETVRDMGSEVSYRINGEQVDLDTAIKVSVSCCAQISYRVLSTSINRAMSIYKKLIEAVPVHASPTEHQATPMQYTREYDYNQLGEDMEEGITHMVFNDRGYPDLWSGNFCGWIQNRQLVPSHVKM